MNPLDWLKALYEAFGKDNPRSSLVVVMVLGALCFAGAWKLAQKQYEKTPPKPTETSTPSPSTGNATANGDHSTAVSGNGNVITKGQSEPDATKKKE